MKNKVYILTASTKHADNFYDGDDGTAIVGVFDDFGKAWKTLEDCYSIDKSDLLDGSCSPDGTCEITEDTPPEDRSDKGINWLGAFAQIVVSMKSDGSFDREYTYEIVQKNVNECCE